MFTYYISQDKEVSVYRGMDKRYYVQIGESVRDFLLIHELEHYLKTLNNKIIPGFVLEMLDKEKTAVFIVDAYDGYSIRTVDFYLYALTLQEVRGVVKELLKNSYNIPRFELLKIKVEDD